MTLAAKNPDAYDTIPYDTILYYTILYYTILYYTTLYYTVLLQYTIRYYTILYYTILYYTILYYTILYYTIFKSLRLRPPTPKAYGKTADFGTLCIPAVRSDVTPVPHFCPRATAAGSLH